MRDRTRGSSTGWVPISSSGPGSRSRTTWSRQTLDGATAAELVLSLWMRRRDAHAFNRAYVDGLPVFFDFSVTFPSSAARQSVEVFLAQPGDGFAGAWSLREIPRATLVTTASARSHHGWGGTHFVTSVGAFAQAARECAAWIAAADAGSVEALVARAGFEGDEAAEVCAWLAAGRRVIQDEVEVMLEIVRRR